MEVVLILAMLICPLVMGGTMVWMMRRMGRGTGRGREEEPE
jgi:hypothetical protein